MRGYSAQPAIRLSPYAMLVAALGNLVEADVGQVENPAVSAANWLLCQFN